MGIDTFGVPEQLALAIKKEFGLTTFVETGTATGGTSRWAARNFDKAVTIEASEQFYLCAQESFAGISNITSLHGDSGTTLAELMPSLGKTLFWLDAHWSTGNTAGEHYECPLLSELSAIMPHFHKHVIMIDDARYFMKPPGGPHDPYEWPSLDDIFRAVQANAQTYSVITQDVLLIVPAVYRPKLTEILHHYG